MSYIKRNKTLFTIACVLAAGAIYRSFFMDWSVVYNATISIPKGWYFVEHRANITHGDLVLFDIPEEKEAFLRKRGWINDRIEYLIKPVAGLEGDDACIEHHSVMINNRDYGITKLIAKDGTSIPQLEFCDAIPPEHFMVAISHHGEHSFDSRYMGAIHESHIEGVATPLWTW